MREIHKILLAGATGFIGRALISPLREAGYEVRPLARSLGHDFNRLQSAADWIPYLRGIDAVINAVGIIREHGQQRFDTLHHRAPAALFDACVQAGTPRVVQLSALGADAQGFTPYQLSKWAADEHLRSLPLAWFVLRPSLVYGEGSRSLRFFRLLARLPVLPLPGGGAQQIQPVHLDDLIDAVLRCLQSEQVNLTLDLVGPRAMRFADWLGLLERQQGRRPARVFHVPTALALQAARLAHHVLPLVHPDNLRMLQQGNVADAGPLERFLGRELTEIGGVS
ncbi:MAG: NAD(P)H-binding protein [Gammaproteobacteria bacterium]|nr:NAD(P)H-binding protein [Gammaproteobacteria bacterium]